ncbi:hypothetical protein F4X88_18415 [Candidatus Poribacteria bacterium]|nr:hypothetical protein [Candidatus Poribacteria bacterium]MYA58262.1 hypothetical protein [Candidatus Poribacteria bacterium]
MVDAAKVVTADVIEEIAEEPFIRAELFDAGVMMRLRYKTRPVDRAKSLSDIVKIVFHGFSGSKRVEFCYAHSEIIYSWKDQPALSASLSEE